MRFLCSALQLMLLACVPVAVGENHDPALYTFHQHSITHPYLANNMEIPYWDFGGSTIVTDNYIRLTPDRQSRSGHLWNTVPWAPDAEQGKYPGWQAIIGFRVHGQGTKLFGDGFAFWYAKDRATFGSVFGSKDQFEGLGIFFDTYSNVQQGHQQYVSVMIGDGIQKYDHSQDGGDAKLAGCSVDFRGLDRTAYAKVIYKDRLLRMYLDVGSGWDECFVLRRVFLPRGYYYGLTAATGDLADNHDVISFKLSEPEAMSDEEAKELEERIRRDVDAGVENELHVDPQYEHRSMNPQEISVWKVVLVVVLLAAIVAAIFVNQTKTARKAATHFT